MRLIFHSLPTHERDLRHDQFQGGQYPTLGFVVHSQLASKNTLDLHPGNL